MNLEHLGVPDSEEGLKKQNKTKQNQKDGAY